MSHIYCVCLSYVIYREKYIQFFRIHILYLHVLKQGVCPAAFDLLEKLVSLRIINYRLRTTGPSEDSSESENDSQADPTSTRYIIFSRICSLNSEEKEKNILKI